MGLLCGRAGHAVETGKRQIKIAGYNYDRVRAIMDGQVSEYILGEINSQIATGPKPSLSIMAKNIGFLVKTVTFATKKAEEHLNKAIELFKKIGMKGYLGVAYLSLGQLYKGSKRTDQARQSILEAINLFQECEAEGWLKQANEALRSLDKKSL